MEIIGDLFEYSAAYFTTMGRQDMNMDLVARMFKETAKVGIDLTFDMVPHIRAHENLQDRQNRPIPDTNDANLHQFLHAGIHMLNAQEDTTQVQMPVPTGAPIPRRPGSRTPSQASNRSNR